MGAFPPCKQGISPLVSWSVLNLLSFALKQCFIPQTSTWDSQSWSYHSLAGRSENTHVLSSEYQWDQAGAKRLSLKGCKAKRCLQQLCLGWGSILLVVILTRPAVILPPSYSQPLLDPSSRDSMLSQPLAQAQEESDQGYAVVLDTPCLPSWATDKYQRGSQEHSIPTALYIK